MSTLSTNATFSLRSNYLQLQTKPQWGVRNGRKWQPDRRKQCMSRRGNIPDYFWGDNRRSWRISIATDNRTTSIDQTLTLGVYGVGAKSPAKYLGAIEKLRFFAIKKNPHRILTICSLLLHMTSQNQVANFKESSPCRFREIATCNLLQTSTVKDGYKVSPIWKIAEHEF